MAIAHVLRSFAINSSPDVVVKSESQPRNAGVSFRCFEVETMLLFPPETRHTCIHTRSEHLFNVKFGSLFHVSFVKCIRRKMWTEQKPVQFLLLPWLVPVLCGPTERKAESVLFCFVYRRRVDSRTHIVGENKWKRTTWPRTHAECNNRIVSTSKQQRRENEKHSQTRTWSICIPQFSFLSGSGFGGFDNSFFFFSFVSSPLSRFLWPSTTMN